MVSLAVYVNTEHRNRAEQTGMQDCAALSWSLGKLAYRDTDLMEAVCDRYVAVCTSTSKPQAIGTISQMLKGATLQRCLTQELMKLLQAQATVTLGSQERSIAALQDILDGCDPSLHPSAQSLQCCAIA